MPTVGAEIRDICLHLKNGERWLGMPSKQYKNKEGEEKWIPLVRFPDKDKWYAFQKATLDALDKYQGGGVTTPATGKGDLPF